MARPALALVWDDRFTSYDFGPDHPFTERSRGLAVRLAEEFYRAQAPQQPGGLVRIPSVESATRAQILQFHEEPYIHLVERLSAERFPGPLDAGDTPAFPGCFQAAALIVGGGLEALNHVENSKAVRSFHPAGGLHHAHPDRASGFCIFNDLAVLLTRWISPKAGRKRVAYVDIDAHHGDGVMYGFYESSRVLDIDFHQDGRTLFPGTGFPTETGRKDGVGFKVNLPLPPFSGDEAFLPLFHRVVPPMIRSFRPELIVLQNGVDAHAGDRLAQLQLTRRSYDFALKTVMDLADELCDGRLLVTGGGGYAAASVSRTLARTALALAGASPPADADPLPVGWRREFKEAMKEPAPLDWLENDQLVRSPWNEDRAEALVSELERSLGVRLPSEASE